LDRITPPLPDVFAGIDMCFSIAFQEQVTYFIVHQIPGPFEIVDGMQAAFKIACLLVESLMLAYVEIYHL